MGQLDSLFDNPILFASREFDAETGFYYNRARYLDPFTGRWTTQDPLSFSAGDANLYRYVGNTPTMLTDPSGLVSGWRHHPYPLYLGGSANQVVIDLRSQARHQAAHNFFTARGFGPGDAGRAAWARLSARQQQAMIIRSLRAAGVSNSWIRANIANIMHGATPGVATPRPSGFPGGVVRVPFVSLATGAVFTLLSMPSTAHAAEIDRSWRGLPPDRTGRVEITEVITTYDMPQVWNFFANRPIVVSSWTNPEWMDLGDMTVREARELEGVNDIHEGDVALAGRPGPPFGYYRIIVTSTVARFNGQVYAR